MLEKPDLPDQLIISRLQETYGLPVGQLTFLPIGADFNTTVYRAATADGAAYFVKLRKGGFDEITVALPKFLHDQGLQAIIAPLETNSQQLSASLGEYRLILYPFIEGLDGYTQSPTDRQWLDFGATLKAVHTAQLPPALRQRIPQETFSPHGREMVRIFQARVENTTFDEPVAAKLAAYMQEKREDIRQVGDRAEQLALELQQRSLEMVLCHADIHPGNLHLTPDGALYLVDWDNPIFAPKERDLALIGGYTDWSNPHQVEMFYQGYYGLNASHRPGINAPGYETAPEQSGPDISSMQSPVHGAPLDRPGIQPRPHDPRQASHIPSPVDRSALAYYRYERIVQDFAAYCEQLLLTDAGGEDREQSFYYFTTNFLPGHVIELSAREIDPAFQPVSTGLSSK